MLFNKPKKINALFWEMAWVYIFEEYLSNFERLLLNASYAEQKKLLSQIPEETSFRANVVCYSILSTSPNIDCLEFFTMTEPILNQPSNRKTLSFCGFFDRSDIAEKLIDVYHVNNSNFEEIERTFEHAASIGSISTISMILKKFPEKKDKLLFNDGDSMLFYIACLQNQALVIQYHMEMCTDEQICKLVSMDHFDAIKKSIKGNCFDVICTLIKIFLKRLKIQHLIPKILSMMSIENYEFLTCVASIQELRMLAEMPSEYKKNDYMKRWIENADFYKPVLTDPVDGLDESVWILIFKSEISPFEKSLLNKSVDNVLCSIKDTLPSEPFIRVEVICFCLLKSKPNIKGSVFFKILKPFLKLNPCDVMLAPAIFNCFDLVKKFLGEDIKYQTEQTEINYCFHFACIYNSLEVIDFLLDEYGIERRFLFDLTYGGCFSHYEAAANGNLYILKRIFQTANSDEVKKLIIADNYNVFTQAIKSKDGCCFDYILNRTFELSDPAHHIIEIFRKISFIPLSKNIKTQGSLWREFKKYNYKMMDNLILWGKKEALRLIIILFPERLSLLIKANNYKLFYFILSDESVKLINFILKKIPFKYIHAMIANNEFKSFQMASKSGCLKKIKQIVNVAPELSRLMLMANYYSSAREAVKLGHEHILDYFFELAPDLAADIISADSYSVVKTCLFNGSVGPLMKLIKSQPILQQEILDQITYFPSNKNSIKFFHAIAPKFCHDLFYININSVLYNSLIYGDTESMIEIFTIFGAEIINLINHETSNINVFNAAVCFKKQDAIDFLLKKSNVKIQKKLILAEGSFEGFSSSAKFRNLNGMKYLVSMFPEYLDPMIRANNYSAFRGAVEYGNIETLNYLFDNLPNEIDSMIAANDYECFFKASLSSGNKTISFLIEHYTGNLKLIIKRDNYKLFNVGCANNIDKMKMVIDFFPGNPNKLISSNNYLIFKNAIENRNIKLVKYLFKLSPKLIKEMIRADDFCGFRLAAKSSSEDLMKLLIENDPKNISKMIKARNYEAFIASAGLLGSYSVTKYIFDLGDRKTQKKMILENSFEVLSNALLHRREKTIKWLLELYPELKNEMLKEVSRIFFSSESHCGQYMFYISNMLLSNRCVLENYFNISEKIDNNFIYPYIKHQLLMLLERKKSLELSKPKLELILNGEEIRSFKFMISCVKSSGDDDLLVRLKELFLIPSLSD